MVGFIYGNNRSKTKHSFAKKSKIQIITNEANGLRTKCMTFVTQKLSLVHLVLILKTTFWRSEQILFIHSENIAHLCTYIQYTYVRTSTETFTQATTRRFIYICLSVSVCIDRQSLTVVSAARLPTTTVRYTRARTLYMCSFLSRPLCARSLTLFSVQQLV